MRSICNKIVKAPFIYDGSKFATNCAVKVNAVGKIEKIITSFDEGNYDEMDVVELENQAIIPGFVNCHSHAFHKFLRGRSCIGASSTEGDNFWKWRNNMYNLLDNISYDKLFSYCKGTFQEMIEAGITSVGEFHYVHHSDILNKNFDLDKAVINAAKATGIRLVLLVTLYTYAGLDRSVELSDKQKHFKSHVDEFLIYVKELKNKVVKEELVTIGIAAHSIRAVHEDDLDKLWQFCANENMPLHMHLEEQPQEIVDCQKFLNKDPSEVLLEKFDKFGKVNLTGVHFSFTKPDLLRKLTNNGTNLCICPTTEGYLGDGIPTLSTNDSIVLGTDCNNRICMIEEARLLAFGQNLKYNNRNNASLDANNLMDILTVNGARSLGLESKIGRFQENYDFDFVSIGVNNVVLSNFANSDELADAIIFSCDNREVVNVCVNGKILFAKKIYSD